MRRYTPVSWYVAALGLLAAFWLALIGALRRLIPWALGRRPS